MQSRRSTIREKRHTPGDGPHHAFRNAAPEGRSACSAAGGPGGLLGPGARQKCRAGERWLTRRVMGETAPPGSEKILQPHSLERSPRRGFSAPPHPAKVISRVQLLSGRLRGTPATDGHRAGCVPGPQSSPASDGRQHELAGDSAAGSLPAGAAVPRTPDPLIDGTAANCHYLSSQGLRGRHLLTTRASEGEGGPSERF